MPTVPLDPSLIMQVGMGFFASRSPLSAVELGMFTKLAGGAMTAHNDRCSWDPPPHNPSSSSPWFLARVTIVDDDWDETPPETSIASGPTGRFTPGLPDLRPTTGVATNDSTPAFTVTPQCTLVGVPLRLLELGTVCLLSVRAP